MNELIRKLTEQRNKAIADMRAVADKAQAENRDLTAEESAQWDSFNSEVDDLQKKIDRETRMAELEAQSRESANGGHNPAIRALGSQQPTQTGDRTETAEYRASLIRYLAANQNDGNAIFDKGSGEQRSILGVSLTGDGATGGILAPTTLEKSLLDFNTDNNVMRKLASVRSSSSDIDIPYTSTHTTAYLVAEGADFTRSTPAFAKVTMKAFKVGALTVVTNEAMQDMFIDMASWIRDDFGEAFARLEENHFINGNGVDSSASPATNEPRGVLKDATSALTSASATAITSDELIDLVYSVKEAYRRNACFLMADSTVKLIRKLKTTDNQYLWQPGMQSGEPAQLLGYKVYTSDQMPTATAGNKAVCFGDFSKYRILDRKGLYLQRLNELYATSGQVGFLAYRRYDGRLLKSDAVKLITMHA